MNTNNILCTCIIAITMQVMVGYCQQDEDMHSKFPDIFHMDDFYDCGKNKDNAYCTANMNLIPKDAKSKLWKEIKDWSIPENHYNHTIIHRTFCVPGKYRDFLGKTSFFESRTNEELKGYNLSAEVFSLDCKQDVYFGTGTRSVLIGVLIYTSLILLATFYDHFVNERDEKSKRFQITAGGKITYIIGNNTHQDGKYPFYFPPGWKVLTFRLDGRQSQVRSKNVNFPPFKVGKWSTCFSLSSNLKKLTSDKNSDYQRLKSIQGIRTYHIMLVISAHIMTAGGQCYIKNTSFIEQLVATPVMQLLLVLMMFAIQIYFVISSWLATNQILKIYKINGRFSIRDGLVLFLHRISRFWVALLASMFINMNLFFTFANGPGNFETVNILSRSCSKNWWATLLQVTNFLHISEVCNLGMWSLSIDTQFYIMCIVFLYVTLNYHLDIKKSLAYMFIFVYMVNVVVFYRGEFPLFFTTNTKLIKRLDFYNSEIAPLLYYFGFWTNAGSSLIGILFGYFYFLYKENVQVKHLGLLCGPTSIFIIAAAVLISLLDANKWVSALVGPLLKPLYAFGIACGIFGMTQNVIQGWPKSICENKYAVWLGNFTFSTYIHHFYIVFSRGAQNTSLVEINVLGLAVSSVVVIVESFALGIVFALVIEQPAVNIKKMILPHIKGKDDPSKKECQGYKHKNKQN